MRKAIIATVIVAAVATSGCAVFKKRGGTPDEFAVARNAPLVIPPDFSLTPRLPARVACRRPTLSSRRSTPCSAGQRRAAHLN